MTLLNHFALCAALAGGLCLPNESLAEYPALERPALSFGPQFSLSGLVEIEHARITLGGERLLPNPSQNSGWRSHQTSGLLLLRSGMTWGNLTVSAQHRLLDRSTGPRIGVMREGPRIETDELYAEYALSDTLFVYMGRRNLSMGQSYGINPADVFFNRLEINRRLPSDRQRSETKGIDMVGFQYLTDTGSSVSGFWAPQTGDLNRDASGDRWLVSYRTRLGAGMTDVTVSAFGGVRPGVSASIVHQTEGNWLFYTDAALRQGRALQAVSAPDSSGAYTVLPRDEDKMVVEATLGTGHTFGNGLTFNLEWTRLAGGLNRTEWSNFMDAVSLNSPPTSAVSDQRLAELRSLAYHAELRRDYLFVRLFQEWLAGTKLQGQMIVLHGLEDGSGSAALRLEYPFTPETSAWLYLNRRYGGSDDEFIQRTERGTVSLGMVHRF
jgi:hypothetical protein